MLHKGFNLNDASTNAIDATKIFDADSLTMVEVNDQAHILYNNKKVLDDINDVDLVVIEPTSMPNAYNN
mgnify:CR=1 FL=1